MSITSGYNKYKRYTKLSDGTYKLVSQWTSSNTVEMDSGSTLQATLGNTSISGIGDGTVTGAIDSLNSNLSAKSDINHRHKYGVAYAATCVVNCAQGTTWNIYPEPSIGFKPNTVIAIAQSNPNTICSYNYDGSGVNKLQFVFTNAPAGNFRFCYVVFYND